MSFLPNNVKFLPKPKPNFEKAVFANLTVIQLHAIIEKYSTGYYPNVVLNIEPMNYFDKTKRTYITKYNMLVFVSNKPASIGDIIAEFKKLLVYHKPER